MNTLLLIIAGIVVLMMSRRFWPRMLHSMIFRPLSAADPPDGGVVPGLLYTGRDVACSGGILAMFGIGLALTWGWAPIFVWIMTGCTLLAGLIAFALSWIDASTPGKFGLDSLGVLFGSAFVRAMRASLIFVLLVWSAMLVSVLVFLLARHPEILASLLLQGLLAWLIWLRLRHGLGAVMVFTAILGGLLAVPAGLLLADRLTDAMPAAGALVAGYPLAVAAVVVALTVALALLPARLGDERPLACLGSVVSVGVLLVGSAIVLALGLERPQAGLMEYFRAEDGPGAIPLILACAGFGIVPLLGLLAGNRPSRLARPKLTRPTAEGIVALAVLAIWLAAPTLAPSQPVQLPDWRGGIDPSMVTGYLLDSIVAITANLPIDAHLRSAIAAATFAGLAGMALVAMIATLAHQAPRLHRIADRLPGMPVVIWLAVTAMAGWVFLGGGLDTGVWLAAGAFTLLFSACLLLAAAYAGARLKRASGTSLLAGGLLMLLFWWVCVDRIAVAIDDRDWPILLLQLLVAATGAICMAVVFANFAKLRRSRRESAGREAVKTPSPAPIPEKDAGYRTVS